MNGYKWIPNALSLSRAPIAFGIAICALNGQWIAAFVVLVIGLLTDLLDGFLAIRLNAKSDFGGKFLEPAADLCLTVGALWGLVFTKTLPWSTVWILIAALATIWPPIFLKKAENRVRLVCEGLAPFLYLAGILCLTIVYAFKAFGVSALLLLIAAIPLTVIVVKAKRHRLTTWFAMIKDNISQSQKPS